MNLQDEKSGSEETASSSRVTTPDPEEIERNIRKIGMKKSINFKVSYLLNTKLCIY